jgi:1,4-dihydroxy-2-naphthoate octaprenyltransferase
MPSLGRRVGLGIGGRGEVSDAIEWARLARDSGLDSIWIHDSMYERDAITYGSAIASALGSDGTSPFRVALGSVNPYTRHPIVLAMTGSALDEMLPERIVMGIGSGLPLRLAQLGIPYSLPEALKRVSQTLDQLRTLWAGERIPSATAGLPAIQPMFPPVHRIPLFIAAYRKEFVELAGQKADGYLARPCESIPSLAGILDRLRATAATAGRDPRDIETAGYLLTLIDKTRREALNRAKREPFVIYMMSILGNVALHRAGFEPELRDRIAAAWRADELHEAGKLVPDDLLDAFMLCGTREDVAERALAFHLKAGLEMPLLQPVLQEDRHVREIIEAARLYASLPDTVSANSERVPAAASVTMRAGPPDRDSTLGRPELKGDRQLGPLERVLRRGAAAWEIVRPFAYTVTVIPVLAGGSLAAVDGNFSWPPFLAALVAAMLVQSGTNVINEVYDVRKGIDTITSPRASQAVLKGRFSESGARAFSLSLFAVGAAIGVYLVLLRGPAMLALGIVGLVGGYTYTAPPFQYKYKGFGVPMIFALMGPLTVVGSYFAVSGTWDWHALVLSAPVGLLVAAIVHGNDWRDIGDDTRAGIVTLSSKVGRRWAHYSYLGLVLGAYAAVGLSVSVHWLPPTAGLVMLSVPFLAQVVQSAELGANGQARAIAKIDLETAHLHLAFGLLLVAGMLLSGGFAA